MKRLQAIIIDDEQNNRTALKNLLTAHCPEINVVGEADSVVSGIKSIDQQEPDIVFLDVQLTDGNGFDILKRVQYKSFNLVFVTAYDHFAIDAFRFSAIDYLLKPINPELLIQAVTRCIQKSRENQGERINNLLTNYQKPEKLAISTNKGIEFIRIKDITRCESDSNYTHLYLKDKRNIIASKTLKEFDELLCPHGFFRVHKSQLVNLEYVEKYIPEDGGYLVMTDNTEVEVSRRKKEEFLSRMMIRK